MGCLVMAEEGWYSGGEGGVEGAWWFSAVGWGPCMVVTVMTAETATLAAALRCWKTHRCAWHLQWRCMEIP